MLILIVLTTFLLVLGRNFREHRANTFFRAAFLCGCLWLLLEVVFYAYLLWLASMRGDFVLVGNQKVLDFIIKTNLVQKIHATQSRPDSVYRLDSDLGYSLGANKDYYGARATNSMGFRADREYAFIPRDESFRIAVFGDSYVFGDQETTRTTWPYLLERSFKNLEVLNFGVSGYGFGQSYLRYLKDGLKFKPDLIVFTYIVPTERDLTNAEMLFGGSQMTRGDFYRVNFEQKGGTLLTRVTDPLDWFDRDFRERFIYNAYGISSGDVFWAWKIFSVSNVLLSVKHEFVGQAYMKLISAREVNLGPENYTMLKNLFEVSRGNNSMVLFFYEYPVESLPPQILELLEQNSDHVVFVSDSSSLSFFRKKYGYGNSDDPRLRNATRHFNPEGNRIYAEALASVLRIRPWGMNDRVFVFSPETQAFVRSQGPP